MAIAVGLFALSKCGGSSTSTTPAPAATTAAELSTPAYVVARSLRCRGEPNATAGVQQTFQRNVQVTITKRGDIWSQVSQPAGDCWVATAFLPDGSPDGVQSQATSDRSYRQSNGGRSTGTTLGIAAIGAGTSASAGRGYQRHSTMAEQLQLIEVNGVVGRLARHAAIMVTGPAHVRGAISALGRVAVATASLAVATSVMACNQRSHVISQHLETPMAWHSLIHRS